MRWTGVEAYIGESERAYKGLAGKFEGRHGLENIGVSMGG
jgi:hypothetical protein